VCGIMGVVSLGVLDHGFEYDQTVKDLQETWHRVADRGRDSWGFAYVGETHTVRFTSASDPDYERGWVRHTPYVGVGNRRGEPTTEWVQTKTDHDVQPFTSPSGRWVFTHNGTIANDKEIYADSTVPAREWDVRPPTLIDSYAIGVMLDREGWDAGIRKLVGSFAILAIDTKNPDRLYVACNYKPLFLRSRRTHRGRVVQVASQMRHLAHHYDPFLDPGIHEIPPYSIGWVTDREMEFGSLYGPSPNLEREKVLVICSGGLDSGTVAWLYHTRGLEVELVHFEYGARAQGPEVTAVEALANAMQCQATFLTVDFFAHHAKSVLTNKDHGEITKQRDGEAGAEFAHEWVPARNTVFMALAMAYAEKHGHDVIAFGANMEEAGAYPDNEPEIINRFNALVPYAVKPYKRLRIESPTANLVKHEIVREGLEHGMPFELTFSCYEAQAGRHCGTCGPCAMRKRAFAMNGTVDPVFSDACQRFHPSEKCEPGRNHPAAALS